MSVKSIDRTKAVIGGLGLVAVIVGLAGFLLVVQPQRSKQSSLAEQIATQQIELANLHTHVQNGKPDVQAAELFQLSRAMPDTVDQAGIVLTLARLAERTGVKLSSLQPANPTALADGAQAVPVNAVILGTWKQVSAFLAAVRNQVRAKGQLFSVAGRLFDIDSIAVGNSSSHAGSSHSAPASNGEIQVTLALNAFVYGVPPAPTTPTTTTSTTPSTSSSQQAVGATGGS
jgi:hypothetical protein